MARLSRALVGLARFADGLATLCAAILLVTILVMVVLGVLAPFADRLEYVHDEVKPEWKANIIVIARVGGMIVCGSLAVVIGYVGLALIFGMRQAFQSGLPDERPDDDPLGRAFVAVVFTVKNALTGLILLRLVRDIVEFRALNPLDWVWKLLTQ